MKRIFIAAAAALLALCLAACGAAAEPPTEESHQAETSGAPAPTEAPAGTGEMMIYAYIGSKTLTIRPENNSSARAFLDLLGQGDLTVSMHDYGGFEKVGSLGVSLPTNDEPITTRPGDVILYRGTEITIYYDVNSWCFTRLGRVEGCTEAELREILGSGDPTVVFSLSGPDR